MRVTNAGMEARVAPAGVLASFLTSIAEASRKSTMSRCSRSLIYGLAVCITLLLLGFLVFAGAATRQPPNDTPSADAIVVLTGGADRRIEAGSRLLRKGLGSRMLISGINDKLKPNDILSQLDLFDPSRVDLGYEAKDTVGNAVETKNWADRHNYTRLIVVTSSYHMPRSMNELTLAMPAVEFIAHPVRPRIFSEGAWWLRPAAARMLIAEYLKLIPSYARTAARKLLDPIAASANAQQRGGPTPIGGRLFPFKPEIS